jgi:hypothetical protein
MALDLEAIRQKVQQLNGTLKKSKINFWRPDTKTTGVYEFVLRVLPWPNNNGQPFVERYFYYNIGQNSGLLAPTQFGKADPMAELIDKLYASGKAEDKEVAKKLYPKMRAFAPIIVRGAEDQGVQVWSFGREIYQRLLELILDAEIGDITDLEEGYDLKVKITKKDGVNWPDTKVDASRKSSKLFTDQEKVDEALAAIPNLDEYYKLKPYAELKMLLEAWSNGDTPAPSGNVGTRRAAPEEKDELDKLTKEIAEEKKPVAKPAEKPSAKAVVAAAKKQPAKVVEESADDFSSSLDAVFDDILDA